MTEIEKIVRSLGIRVHSNSNNELTCFCPFHTDEHPSLSINTITGKFLCRAGCIKGARIQTLAKAMGVNTMFGMMKVTDYVEKKKDAVPWIPMNLPLAIDNPAYKFLKGRGFYPETIKYWNLLFWDEKRVIVIPIPRVGYILRYIDPDSEKKYKYVPGTRIGGTLFGWHNYRDQGSVILVEGAFDTIWLWQNEIKNSVALLHSDITKAQVEILRGINRNVTLMMDGDDAGQAANERIKNVLEIDGFHVCVKKLGQGVDPNDCSKEQLREVLK